ncbi:hypothetical protein [Paenibacillus sp. BC26]|uniref:hypothetical protein n=1 Tax=Paenibacillus sp. BC26 TaxID=1881032 RepID=UPI000B8674C9|nr:hypothetical protein [Paenibacillus sp. BC26]
MGNDAQWEAFDGFVAMKKAAIQATQRKATRTMMFLSLIPFLNRLTPRFVVDRVKANDYIIDKVNPRYILSTIKRVINVPKGSDDEGSLGLL